VKSITIKDKKGELILKVIKRKNGRYEMELSSDLKDKIDVTVRDEKGHTVLFR